MQAVLDGEAAEGRLGEDQDAGGDRAADQPAPVAKAPEGLDRERDDQHDHERGHDAMAELDHLVLLEEREHAAAAERPAVVPLPAAPQPSPESLTRTTPPITISAKVARMVAVRRRRKRGARPPRRGGRRRASRSGYRGAVQMVPRAGSPRRSRLTASGSEPAARGASGGGGGRQLAVRSSIALRMSCSGSALRTSGTASKLCSGGGESVNHSSVAPRHGSWPGADAVSVAVGGVAELEQDPDREHEGRRSRRRG